MRHHVSLVVLTLLVGCASAPAPPGETSGLGSELAPGVTATSDDRPNGATVPAANEETLPTKTGKVELGGSSLFYEEAGEGQPIILAHGGMLDSRMWDDQFQVLARRFRVIRFDARGHGQSVADSSEHSPHEDLSVLLDRLEIDKAILVGHSMGARVAINFAIVHPDRVLALVAVAPGLGGYIRDEFETNQNYGLLARALQNKEYDLAVEYFQRLYTDGPLRSPFEVDPNTRAKVREMVLAVFESEQHPGRTRSINPPAAERLSEIAVPTLVIHGDLDTPATVEISTMLEQQIVAAKRVVIPGTAHMVNMEQPQEFNAELSGFLNQTFP